MQPSDHLVGEDTINKEILANHTAIFKKKKKLTRKDMFMDSGQLYIGLGRVGNNQTIDNPF